MTYKIGIVGARRGASLAAAFGMQPDCRVAAVCDLDEDRLASFREQFPSAKPFSNLDDMLARPPDVVVVASPVPLHRDHTLAALQAGSHVLQEVVLASTLDQCQDIVDAVKARPAQKFMLSENCCYWGHVLAWQRLFADGRLGNFIYAEAEYVHDVRSLLTDDQGRPTWRASLPPIHYCSHSLGPLLLITGEQCVSVTGMHTGSKLSPDLGSIDTEVALIQTASGGVIKMLMGFGVVREPSFHYYSIYGTGGCLETARPPAKLATSAYLGDVPHLHNMVQMPLDYNLPGAPSGALSGGHGTAEYYLVRDFMEAVRHDGEPRLGIEEAVAMCVPGLCAHESAVKGGQTVPIPRLI